jgi:hypothetical protein
LFQAYPHYCQLIKQTPREVRCSPLMMPGPIAPAKVCSRTQPASFCRHPFYCLPTQHPTGFCTRQCKTNLDCLTVHPKAQCNLRENVSNFSYCGFPCSSNADCPNPFICNKSFCIPP